MESREWDPLALAAAANALAVSLAAGLKDGELELAAALLTQIGDTLSTISIQRARQGKPP